MMDPAFLTDKLTEYVHLHNVVSKRIQTAGPTYEAAAKAWNGDVKRPVKYTEAEVAEYFSKADKAYARIQEPNLSMFELYYMGIGGAMAAQVLWNFIAAKRFSYADIMNEANRRVMQKSAALKPSGPPFKGIPDNELHMYLTDEQRGVTPQSETDAEEELVGQDILFEDLDTGKHCLKAYRGPR
ncbi:hypothetical protein AX17_002393 [Amanita inopinata Kibby_2008]|nr:hypothetical protein AX17_002393 [Amanita inopinata Kibby_2008]